ncbi:hypothetical protein P3X46_012075 [Hevea brasiliensis]|uniref:Uncharacterized protein n=1 Tax=Hevea brasiliensis TaxID=3981 RepID=A0ABQ9MCZ4_HEVBR|nr:hypothetical protein P3X46_012075 [Hevea brasiliensis]
MGRQNSDATVASSSIALLQERFRELQKIREKRKEKELLKLFSESERSSAPPGMHFEPSKLTYHQPETILPNKAPALQDSHLSLGLNTHSNNHGDTMKTSTSLWPNTGTSSSRNFESPDVDTSLHL